MKKVLLTLAICLFLAPAAHAKFSKIYKQELGHNVVAETKVTRGSEVVLVTFKNHNGILGTVSLSPANWTMKNLKYKLHGQKLIIRKIQLSSSHHTYDPSSYNSNSTQMGSVILNARITNWSGRDSVYYKGVISHW